MKSGGWRLAIVRAVETLLPEALTFAILMTGLALALAVMLTPATPLEAVVAWGDGLSVLLAFTAQMALMVLFAYALAHIGPIPGLLRRLAGVPSSERGARVFLCLFTGIVSLLAWPLGLIFGGLMVKSVGRRLRALGLAVDPAALGAAAFGGFVVWHMGYSASAPLFVATAGNAMEEQLGGLIPVTETILAPWNLLGIVLTLAAVTLAGVWGLPLTAKPARATRDEPRDEGNSEIVEESEEASLDPRRRVDALAESRVTSTLLGALLLVFLGAHYWQKGVTFDLNIVNWTFLCLGLLMTHSPREYFSALMGGGRTVAPILLLYPLYSGVMGLMLETGLVERLSEGFASMANETTLPIVAFFSGGLINMFVPSGGAQWAVQGPTFVEAARVTGTELPQIVMSIAYGDQWTNLIHPFIIIPFALMGELDARRVLADCSLAFLAAGAALVVTLLIAGAGWV
jgi:short-chain fatty acids transporter